MASLAAAIVGVAIIRDIVGACNIFSDIATGSVIIVLIYPLLEVLIPKSEETIERPEDKH